MNRALHFPTKQNSRDIRKFNCFWVPSYDLFASPRKAVFPALTATGVHKFVRNMWSSLSEVICPPKVQQSLLNQSLDQPPPQSKMPWFTTFTLTTIHLIYPPPPPAKKNCISIVFKFSWENCKFQDNTYAKLLGGNQGILWECESSKSAPRSGDSVRGF